MDKNSFILYTDYFEQIQALSIEQRGVLLTACMCYQLGRELPEMDAVTKMAYMFISADMRRNNEKYDKIVERRREAGRKGGKQTQANQANATFASSNQANQANASDNDNDNENVNDNENDNGDVNVNESASQTETKTPPSLEEVSSYIKQRHYHVDAERFYLNYQSKNWMSGNTRITDWKSLVDRWEKEDKEKQKPSGTKFSNYTQERTDVDWNAKQREVIQAQLKQMMEG